MCSLPIKEEVMKPGYENYYDDSYDEYVFPPARNGFHGNVYDDYDDDYEDSYMDYDVFEENGYYTDEDYYS